MKILSDLDIAERRIPQDGRISLEIEDKHIDLRVATLPAAFGENVVMRILDQSKVQDRSSSAGHAAAGARALHKAFAQSHGAVLVTGPTGSGKSTSLYAALNQLNTIEKNIITIEDPVEYQLDGITQVQVNQKAGLTFASGLRSMMRADPDIIMVGEIRDRETAQIAIEAALTGHLVLSTLHTNDAPGAVTRLIEMGIEPFLVGSAVDCVVAQRLARLLCEECKRRMMLPSEVMRANGFNVGLDLESYEPVGCARCGGSGYKGRIGLYEVMWVSETIRAPRGRPRALRDDRPRGGARGHDAPARGRPREGPPRPDLDRRDRPRRGHSVAADALQVARRPADTEKAHELRLLRDPPRGRQAEGVRPPHHRRRAADAAYARLARADGGAAEAHADRHARDHLRDPQLVAAPAPGDGLAARLRLLRPGPAAASASTPTSSAARSAPRSA